MMYSISHTGEIFDKVVVSRSHGNASHPAEKEAPPSSPSPQTLNPKLNP